MYESYWQLQAKPFDTARAAFYFPSEAHEGSLLKLRYAVENHRAAALLVGPSGVGKTLLIRTLREQLSADFGPWAHLVFPELSPRELLAYVATALGAGPSDRLPSTDESVLSLEHLLVENHQRGKHAVVVIDEAHLLADTDTLESLRLLTNFEVYRQAALTLLLVGKPTLLPALERMPQFEERFAVKSLLRPLHADETRQYIKHRLRAAGAQRPIFLPDALEAVHQLTHGIPRRIDRLCDLALLIGYAEERPDIGAAQVENVAEELVCVGPE